MVRYITSIYGLIRYAGYHLNYMYTLMQDTTHNYVKLMIIMQAHTISGVMVALLSGCIQYIASIWEHYNWQRRWDCVMASFSRIQEFNAEAESLSAYVEWVEFFFQESGIKEDKKAPVCIHYLHR